MKLPRRVSVGGQWWTVHRRSGLTDKGTPLAGRVLYKKRRILIRWGLEPGAIVPTLIHEIIHAAVPDLDEFAVGRIEEAIVVALSQVTP